MADFIRHSQFKEMVRHRLDFWSLKVRGAGLGFDVDEHGCILEPLKLSDAEVSNLIRGLFGSEYTKPTVETERWTVRDPAVIRCSCGSQVTLDSGWVNDCDRCGAMYNGGGQRLSDPRQWGEETGESFDAAGNYIVGEVI